MTTLHLRTRRTLPNLACLALFGLCASAAHALTVDPKALARYDNSYVHCEKQYPDMRGHRDEAYLSLWRVKLDAKTGAQLAATRKGAPYLAEKKRVQQAAAKGAASAASGTLDQQCQALWSEAQRMQKSK